MNRHHKGWRKSKSIHIKQKRNNIFKHIGSIFLYCLSFVVLYFLVIMFLAL